MSQPRLVKIVRMSPAPSEQHPRLLPAWASLQASAQAAPHLRTSDSSIEGQLLSALSSAASRADGSVSSLDCYRKGHSPQV